MLQAKASERDIQAMIDYFNEKEEENEYGMPRGWRRVVFGYTTMFEYCCDPSKSHLALTPYLNEIHVAPEQ